MFGLPGHIITLLQHYFKTHPAIIKVIVFGSRALQTEKPGSDVDLAIITTGKEDISGRIKIDLEELPTPYLFDIIDYNKITHTPLRAHIDRAGKILYESVN